MNATRDFDLFPFEDEKINALHLRSAQARDEAILFSSSIFCSLNFARQKKLILLSRRRVKVSTCGLPDYLIRMLGEPTFSAETKNESKQLVEALRAILRKVF